MEKEKHKSAEYKFFSVKNFVFTGLVLFAGTFGAVTLGNMFPVQYTRAITETFNPPAPPPVLDTKLYDAKLLALANNPVPKAAASASSTDPISPTSTVSSAVSASSTAKFLWPVKTVYPNVGAILPFSRIVAYYGNFFSKNMGVLGEYPPEEMISRLKAEVANWTAADPATPVVPAIDYIAVTAQGSPGADGKYRARMPYDQIDKAISLAAEVNGLVFLDIQVGLSNLQTEVPLLEKYLKMPQVELSIDPEFAMHGGAKPGSVIGSLDAADVNYCANYLAKLVQDNKLPPKILVVHRFTEAMLTNYKKIAPLPEVQVVIDMDGWGFGAKKINTYSVVAYSEPVQFTGFKLFYKNDLKPPSKGMLTPAEVLKLTPNPSYIQYQ